MWEGTDTRNDEWGQGKLTIQRMYIAHLQYIWLFYIHDKSLIHCSLKYAGKKIGMVTDADESKATNTRGQALSIQSTMENENRRERNKEIKVIGLSLVYKMYVMVAIAIDGIKNWSDGK
jgi:hypothetical protein